MDETSDDIDEVALNVLLAEGVDLPTTIEASWRERGEPPAGGGCLGAVVVAAGIIWLAIVGAT